MKSDGKSVESLIETFSLCLHLQLPESVKREKWKAVKVIYRTEESHLDSVQTFLKINFLMSETSLCSHFARTIRKKNSHHFLWIRHHFIVYLAFRLSI